MTWLNTFTRALAALPPEKIAIPRGFEEGNSIKVGVAYKASVNGEGKVSPF